MGIHSFCMANRKAGASYRPKSIIVSENGEQPYANMVCNLECPGQLHHYDHILLQPGFVLPVLPNEVSSSSLQYPFNHTVTKPLSSLRLPTKCSS